MTRSSVFLLACRRPSDLQAFNGFCPADRRIVVVLLNMANYLSEIRPCFKLMRSLIVLCPFLLKLHATLQGPFGLVSLTTFIAFGATINTFTNKLCQDFSIAIITCSVGSLPTLRSHSKRVCFIKVLLRQNMFKLCVCRWF